nr:MAG TPA: hypothetical protein [Caudoviricetes sp.]
MIKHTSRRNLHAYVGALKTYSSCMFDHLIRQ